jgi:hypothetical protein
MRRRSARGPSLQTVLPIECPLLQSRRANGGEADMAENFFNGRVRARSLVFGYGMIEAHDITPAIRQLARVMR